MPATRQHWDPVAPTLGQRVWRLLCRWLVRTFYSQAEVTGQENVPPTGPLLFCANHVNALVDAVVVQAGQERPIHPLARSGLFRSPLLRPLLAMIQAVPIYRRRTDSNKVADSKNVGQSRNQDSFERCYEYLAKGRALLIFPEGQSHSDPSLRPLKTGAARLAAGFEERHGERPTIIPVGLIFPQKGRFRSEVLVQFGPPVPLPAMEDKDQEARIRAWTDAIGEGLAGVTLNVDSWEDLELLQLLHDFFDLRGRGRRSSLEQRFRTLQWLIETQRWLRITHPTQVALVTARLRRFGELCRQYGVEDYHLSLRYRPWVIVRFLLRALAFAIFVVPPALWGFLNAALPYYATRWISQRTARGRDQYDTAGMLFGLFFFLTCWSAQVFGVSWFWGNEAAIAYALSLPIAAGIALKLGRERRRVAEHVRVFWLFLRKERLKSYLQVKRSELEIDLARLSRLGRGGAAQTI